MKAQLYIFYTLLLTTFLCPYFSQAGKIYGTITDKTNNEPLIGATVLVIETGHGTITELDGTFELHLEPGGYTLEISYAGYQSEKITDLKMEDSKNIKLDFQLSAATSVLETVIITASAKRNSYANLMLLQQKSTSIVTGISADQMKLSPDRNTGDVLKRVSGTSVQDNKYVVIRGLADRYNAVLINGLSLPSTEPDKRAFSFDIFPSNLLDNLIIYKTATPDLPAEFAGGVIQLNTKEIPQESFSSFSVSMGYNSQSTFKGFKSYRGGNKDWIGYDDGTRALPATLENVSRDTFNNHQIKYARAFPNDWAIYSEASMRPSLGLQFSAGKSFGKLGVVGALTYGNSPKIARGERGDFNVDGSGLYQYFDDIYKNSVSAGGLVNLAYKLAARSRIQFNNTFTVSADDQLVNRTGSNYDAARIEKSNSFYYASNALYASQLIGEHAFTQRQIKLNWAFGFNRITRSIPSYRRMLYTQNFGSPDEENPFVAVVPFGNPSPNYSGIFYADQKENFYTGKLDLTVPYSLGTRKGNLKIGGLWENKDRDFGARLFGFISSFQTPQELYLLPIGEIFSPENIGQQGFGMKETTDRSDSYDAGSTQLAGYAMVEQSLSDRLRFTGGVRVEEFNQALNSFRILSTVPVILDTVFTDVMPSAHFIYALSDSTNIRASIAQTIARPNFRELAPFSFFDFFLFAGMDGNPALERTKIWNADLRFETFRRGGQYFAVSVFYKHFDNPIEQVFNNAQGAGTRNFQWQNVPSAYDLGGEVEGRIKLGKLAGFLEDFTVFGNLSYIFSKVDISQIPGALERPLFGQSPYLVNAGLNYDNREIGFTSTLLFNRIGRRVWLVGQDQYLHTYEAPRSVLDFQVTKHITKSTELKLTIGDILNQETVFYQDYDNNGKYNANNDKKIAGQQFGTNVSLGFSYSLSKE